MKENRRKFLKYGFVSAAAMFAAAIPVRFTLSEGFLVGKSRRNIVDIAEAHAMCGAAFNCSGGGGQCGGAFNCSGS